MLCPQARRDAAEEVSLRFDLLFHQGLDQRGRVHGHLIDLLVVDSCGLDKSRPELEITATDVKGNRLTLEVLRLVDTVFLERKNSDWRAGPNARDCDEVESSRGAVHHHCQIENPEIILPLINRHADPAGTKAAVDGHVESALFPKAHLLRDERVAEGVP
jgi:hypothetical protein